MIITIITLIITLILWLLLFVVVDVIIFIIIIILIIINIMRIRLRMMRSADDDQYVDAALAAVYRPSWQCPLSCF